MEGLRFGADDGRFESQGSRGEGLRSRTGEQVPSRWGMGAVLILALERVIFVHAV